MKKETGGTETGGSTGALPERDKMSTVFNHHGGEGG